MFFMLMIMVYIGIAEADYECVCNYNVEQSVLPYPNSKAQPIGYLYEFDCKPTFQVEDLDTENWHSIAFEGQVAYLQAHPNIQDTICGGQIPEVDLITTIKTTVQTTASTRLADIASTTSNSLALSSSIAVPKMSTVSQQTTDHKQITINITEPPGSSGITSLNVTASQTFTSSMLTSILITGSVLPGHISQMTTNSYLTNQATSTDTASHSTPHTGMFVTTNPSFNSGNGTDMFPVTSTTSSDLSTNETTYYTSSNSTSSLSDNNVSISSKIPHHTSRTHSANEKSTVSSSYTSNTLSPLLTNEISTQNPQNTFSSTSRNTLPSNPVLNNSSASSSSKLSMSPATNYITTDTVLANRTTSIPKPSTTLFTTNKTAINAQGYTSPTLSTNGITTIATTISSNMSTTKPIKVPTTYPVPSKTSTPLSTKRTTTVPPTTTSTTTPRTTTPTSTTTPRPTTPTSPTTPRPTTPTSTTTPRPTTVTSTTTPRPTTPTSTTTPRPTTPTSTTTPRPTTPTSPTTPRPTTPTSTTTPRPTTPTSTTTPRPTTPSIIGDISLCPAIIFNYTTWDVGALTQYGGHCYELVPTKVIWRKAELDCRAKGGHLISIHTRDFQDYIYKWVSRTISVPSIWLGLSDLRQEGRFEWISGETLITPFWYEKPVTSTIDNKLDCVQMVFGSPAFGKWATTDCGQTSPTGDYGSQSAFICQFPIQQIPPNAPFVGR